MALNKFMHSRNIYKRPPNFKQLALDYPEFRKHVTQELNGRVTVDFKNAAALRCLTQVLLKKDFGLAVDLPLDRLIPTVPQRVNYILWLEDILHASKQKGSEPVKGVDIGTGASCVYPLLGCKMNNWQFLATDVDEENLVYARRNVEKNGLSEMITVERASEDSILGCVVTSTLSTFDFCMCNPPFFADHMEAQGLTSRTDDRPEPHSSSTASCVEQIADGGEITFVKKMIHESLLCKDKVRLFTSMLGKKSSLASLKNELRNLKVPVVSSTEFCQGRTMRWAIGWSWDETVVFPKSLFQVKKKDKPPLVYVIPKNGRWESFDVDTVAEVVKGHLNNLQIKYNQLKSNKQFVSLLLCAKENTWSNMRRKRRALKQQKMMASGKTESGETTGSQTGGDNPTTILDPDLEATSTPLNTECSADIGEGKASDKTESGETTGSQTGGDNPITVLDPDLKATSTPPLNTECSADTGKGKAEVCSAAPQEEKRTSANSELRKRKLEKENCVDQPLDKKHCIEDINKCDQDVQGRQTAMQDTCGDVQNSGAEEFLFKCMLELRQPGEDEVVLEMSWLEGQNRESMHQVMQYVKNQLKGVASTQVHEADQ